MSTNIHRAIVSYSNASTGEIKVRIPAKFGSDVSVSISYIGRTAYNGVWAVPEIGSQIVVTADDDSFTNVFWVQIVPKLDKLDNLILDAVTDNYTLVLANAQKLVTLTKSTSFTVTVPPSSSVAFDIGDQVNLMQLGAGQITVAAGSGVTVSSQGAKLKLNGQYATGTLVKVATDSWVLIGNLAV